MKKFIFSLASIVFTLPIFAQTVISIGNENISKEEFYYYYQKNNENFKQDDTIALEEYIDLFSNFKLKVQEAYELKLDTAKSFKTELNGYRDQLSLPYLIDNETRTALIKEAYEHMKEEVLCSHILFRLAPNPSPADTLKAYNKAIEIKTKLAKEKFEDLAIEYSEDPSAKENKGSLGYITAMNLVYPFEKAAYDTPIGEISGPIRTRFGYHLIKVDNKRPSKGEVKVAHIYIKKPAKADASTISKLQATVDSLYNLLQNGGDFAQLAQENSQDRSATNGGELPWMGTGRTNQLFEDTSFGLKAIGDFSAPIEANYGWHIIKLIDKRAVQSFEEAHDRIEKRVKTGAQAAVVSKSFIDKLKAEYNYKKSNNKDLIATFADNLITKDDLKRYVLENPQSKDPINDCIAATLFEYEKAHLEKKHPEFRLLMQEYKDGMLLFEISNKKIWSNQSTNADSLSNYFKSHKKDFQWEEPHYKGKIISCTSEEVKKMAKKIAKKAPKDSISYYLKEALNKDSIQVKIQSGIYTQGKNKIVDANIFKTGEITPDKDFPEVLLIGKLQKKYPSSYKDIRGLVISSYQDYLETEWIKSLKKKYPITIYPEAF